nr:hypothetical protein [Lachnospiraceae bacterium]
KAKEDISYNLADCSEPAVGSATSTFSEVKSLTATNYSTGKIQLKWNLLKLITKYNIERIEVTEGGSTPSADDSNWKLIHSFPSDGKKTSQATYIDETAIPGQYYYYRIQPATDKSESVNKTATKKSVVSIPLSLTGLTAHYYSGNTGAKLTWGYNSKEADTKYQTRVEVTYGNESFYEVTTDAATSCIDYTKLSSGSERSYKVTPIYYYTDPASGKTREVRGKTKTVAYSKPSEIGFYDKDYNEISSYELYVGESTTIRGYALISKDGRKAATVRGLSYSVSGDACNISKGEEDDHSNFNIEAKNAGEVTLTVWADCNSNIRKSIKIKVKKR